MSVFALKSINVRPPATAKQFVSSIPPRPRYFDEAYAGQNNELSFSLGPTDHLDDSHHHQEEFPSCLLASASRALYAARASGGSSALEP